jgi:hypothetical protein
MSMLAFWVVTPCGLLGKYQHFFFRAKDRDSMFLRNVDLCLKVDTTLQPRRQYIDITAVRNTCVT